MPRTPRLLLAAALVATALSAHTDAHAQNLLGPDDSRIVGLGVQVGPQYDGSDDMSIRPGITGRFPLGGVDVELRGTSLRTDLVGGPLTFGPVLAYRFGRDGANIDDVQVAALPGVDDAVELGVHAMVPLGMSFAVSAEILHDVSGAHDGTSARLSLDGRHQILPATTLFGSAGIGLMDASFADAFYGVSAAGAAASGLATYDAGGGLRDASLTVGVTQELSERLSFTGALTYREMLGDAADSPITQTGNGGQVSLVAGLGVRF